MAVKIVNRREELRKKEIKKHGQVGRWVKKNKDTLLIGIGLTGIAIQLIRIFKK